MKHRDTYYTVKEVAEIVGVSRDTILRWERVGLIKKAKRDFRNWRVYTQDDVDEVLAMVNSFRSP